MTCRNHVPTIEENESRASFLVGRVLEKNVGGAGLLAAVLAAIHAATLH